MKRQPTIAATASDRARILRIGIIAALSMVGALFAMHPATAQDVPSPAASADASASPDPTASPAAADPSSAPDVPDSDLGESARAVHELRAVTPKTVIFVFDISGSMRGKLLQRAREATINIIREGTLPGDRIVLLTFGADYHQVFDTTLNSEADKRDLVNQIPNQPEPGAGTNIRKPHHEALKILEASLPKPGAVILLTDSYNDEPNTNDDTYPMYLKYYTPGGRLTKYPDTPENRDYERLLREITHSRKVKFFGIGVQIDSKGRPIERLPQAEPSPSDTSSTPAAPVTVAAVSEDKKDTFPLPFLLGGIAVLLVALVAGLVYYLQSAKPVKLRILGGPAGSKDFDLRAGQSLTIGGGSQFAFDAYPIPELKDAAALIHAGSGGRMSVNLPPAPTSGVPSSKVFHNGLPLERDTPLNYGDEVRIAVPDASGAGIQKEYRLKFDDPTKSF